jgi:putative ABC transport system permease protein
VNRVIAAMRIAFRGLKVNKLRSALTMLGIIIGVAAVIAMLAVGSGASQRIKQQIASIGSNIIIVIPGSITASGIRLGTGNAVTLTSEDAKAVARDCPSVQAVAPSSRGGAQVIFGNSNWATSIYGTTPDYLSIRDIGIQSGSAFTQQDVDADAKVALLGQTVVDNLFAGADPIGRVIRIKQVPFTVTGTLVPKGQPHWPGSGRHCDFAAQHSSEKSLRRESSPRGFGRIGYSPGARP